MASLLSVSKWEDSSEKHFRLQSWFACLAFTYLFINTVCQDSIMPEDKHSKLPHSPRSSDKKKKKKKRKNTASNTLPGNTGKYTYELF